MSSKMISIIIPCFNVEKYIDECMLSITSQTIVSKLKVIFIDDGSTDRTLVKLKQYEKEFDFVRVINQENKGQSAARNVGLEMVDTEFFSFIDSDDWVNPNFYESLLTGFTSNEVDLVVGKMNSVFEDGRVDVLNGRSYLIDDFNFCSLSVERNFYIKEFLKDRLSVSPCNKLYRYSSFSNLKFTEGLYNEDMEFALDLWLNCSIIAKSDDAIYYYRQRSLSTTKINSERVLDMLLIANNITMKVQEKFPDKFIKELTDFRLFFCGYLTLLRVRNAEASTKIKVFNFVIDYFKDTSIFDVLTCNLLSSKRKFGLCFFKLAPQIMLKFW
ncbi:glycosyltransferase family 2 protein [Shewanella baltica]|uniref:glycosyltransferase family 2 protein n=1 Tax=Shewanella baltica TaxID=62322 RepID=UPI003D029020